MNNYVGKRGHAARKHMVRAQKVFRLVLKAFGLLLGLVLISLVLGELGRILGIGWFSKRLQDIHFALQLRFLDAFGLVITPLVGGFDLGDHRLI